VSGIVSIVREKGVEMANRKESRIVSISNAVNGKNIRSVNVVNMNAKDDSTKNAEEIANAEKGNIPEGVKAGPGQSTFKLPSTI
jgi:hypothetical protein